MTRLAPIALSLLATLSACADYGLALNAEVRGDGAPTDEQGEHDWSDVSALRVDVHPADGGLDILSQTFWIDHLGQALDGNPVELHLAESVELTGYVTAYQITPWDSSDLPGSFGPVDATVALRQPGTVQSIVVSTHSDGFYQASLVPDEGYRLEVIPDDPAVPAWVADVDVTAEGTLDLDLGSGTAFYGRILDGEGVPLAGAAVHLASGELRTASSLTDPQGWYLVRARADTQWSVVCVGRDDGRDPTLTSGAVALGGSDTRVDLTYASLETRTLSGRVLDDLGRPLHRAVVSLAAVDLDGYPSSTTHSLEVLTSSQGTFTTVVLPGTWSVEVRPEDGPASTVELSPVSLGRLDIDDDVDLGAISLAPFTQVRGLVVDPYGEPVAGTLVRATEVGLGERSWSVHTTEDGTFELLGPQVPVEFALSPPADRSPELALTRSRVDLSAEASPTLSLGWGERLGGLARDPWGEPLAYALVEVRDPVGDLLAVTVTDDQGRFEVGVAP